MRLFPSGQRPMAIVLGATIAILTVALIASALSGTHVAMLLATAPIQVPQPPAGFSTQAAPFDTTAIDGATLFYASRRYRAPPATAPSVQPPPYQLIGTLVIPGRPALAFLKNDTTGTSTKVAAGDMLQGWRVEAVENQDIVVTSGGERRVIGQGLQGNGSHQGGGSAGMTSAVVTNARLTSGPGASSSSPARHHVSVRTLGPNFRESQRSATHSPLRHTMEAHRPTPPGYVTPGEKIDVDQLYRGPGQ